MEIERKWLTFGWPEGLKAAAVIRMEQGYIATRPTVRIRLEERGEQVRRVLCFKGKAGPDGLAREEIETDVTPELFQRLERLIGRPLIRKEQRRCVFGGRPDSGGQPCGSRTARGVFLRRGGVSRSGGRPELAARPSGGISGPRGHRDAR
ncbi:MAG: hypothetical protein ACLUJG_13880 [Lawsonibacter sp.]